MRVHLCRHADAVPDAPDELRPLSDAGVLAAGTLAEHLAGAAPRPTTVLCSPLVRTRQTAEIVAQALGVRPLVDTRLAPGATADDLRAALTGLTGPVVTVGHQPDCSEIVAALTGETVSFAPGATVALEVDPADDAS